jgi:hypothetical protein
MNKTSLIRDLEYIKSELAVQYNKFNKGSGGRETKVCNIYVLHVLVYIYKYIYQYYKRKKIRK